MNLPKPYYTHRDPPKTPPPDKPAAPPLHLLPPVVVRTAAHVARREAKLARKP